MNHWSLVGIDVSNYLRSFFLGVEHKWIWQDLTGIIHILVNIKLVVKHEGASLRKHAGGRLPANIPWSTHNEQKKDQYVTWTYNECPVWVNCPLEKSIVNESWDKMWTTEAVQIHKPKKDRSKQCLAVTIVTAVYHSTFGNYTSASHTNGKPFVT